MDQDDKGVTAPVPAENTTPASTNSADDPAPASETATPAPSSTTADKIADKDTVKPAEPLENENNSKTDEPATLTTNSGTNGTDANLDASKLTEENVDSTDSDTKTEASKPAGVKVDSTDSDTKTEASKPAEVKVDSTDSDSKTEASKPAEVKVDSTDSDSKTEASKPVEVKVDSTDPDSKTEASKPAEVKVDSTDSDTNAEASKSAEENVDITDAMMENLRDNFNQDVDSMVSLMESAEEFMFESDDKQLNIKAAIEANKRKKEQESKSVINSDKSEAYSLLAQGKRNLFVKDYESAVSTLGEACQKLNSIYGEFAVEVADAYMTYGNALLELWRVEEADKKNNEENGEVLDNTQEENEDENDENGDENGEEKDADESENKSDENKENEEGDGDKEDDENNEEKDEDGEEDIENEEDNLQIAWEVVELAKQIYLRHNDNVNSAKAYLKLAEISIANGNYELSVEDLNRSLDIQKNITPADNRLKANTHFNLYVAYSASHNYDKSAEHLDTAKSVFEAQVDDLSQKLKSIDKSNTAEIDKITKEIRDTEDIIKDMDSKVLENNKHKREFMTALFEAIKSKTPADASQSNGSGSSKDGPSSNNLLGASNSNNLLDDSSSKNSLSGTSSSNVPVNNITNLIRKKPKEKVEPSVGANSPSKPNTAATLNGKSSIAENPVSNSNSESSIAEKTASNSNSESSLSTNGSDVKETQEDQESNRRKRKASESCDGSPKKVCLENE